jgi:hypothetical protein
MEKKFGLLVLLFMITAGMWAQQGTDNSSTDTVAFTVAVTYMTQGGVKKTDTTSVFASDPRAAEREAEAQFKKTNSRSTFIRAEASVDESYLPKENTSSARSSRSVAPNPTGTTLFTVTVTYMTQGGTKRTDSITVQASDPRAAEREAEAQFKKTNSRSTFIRAVTE